jgi:methionine-rich copper-binding protein CopC
MLNMRRRLPVAPTVERRGIAVLVAAGLATIALLVTGTTAAQAHDELVGSSPQAGARLDAAPAEVELQFSGAIQELGTEVVVTAPDGTAVSDGPVLVDGAGVVQRLTTDIPAGDYTVIWRATSADGHPLSGDWKFTVAGGGTTGVATSSSAAPDPTTDVGEASASTPAPSPSSGVWIAGAAALLLLVAALVGVRQLRRRS